MGIVTSVPYFDESSKCCKYVHLMFPNGIKSPPFASRDGALAFLDVALEHGNIQADVLQVLRDMAHDLDLPEESGIHDFDVLFECDDWDVPGESTPLSPMVS